MSNCSAPTFGDPRLPERFWVKAVEDLQSGCWLWTAAKHQYGYGLFYVQLVQKRAHRIAYEALVGEIPEGLVIDHLCRVRHCVNPAHLEPVTNTENLARGVGRSAYPLRMGRCIRGHERIPENLRRGQCRLCQNIAQQEYRKRQVAEDPNYLARKRARQRELRQLKRSA